MDNSYRERVRAAILDIAGHIAIVQERVTNATNEYERAKAQGKLAELHEVLATQRSQVFAAKAALEQGVEKMKELATQIPADSDDAGLFDALALAREAVESAERFSDAARGESAHTSDG
jgi:hypothetical protein